MEAKHAISLWQPWASLLFVRDNHGSRVKFHETRHWVPAQYGVIHRTSRIIIHAAKTKEGYRGQDRDLHKLCADLWGDDYRDRLPLGAAIGTAEFQDWYPADERMAVSANDLLCGNWGPGRFAWRFCEPDLYMNPVPMKGRQGFWRVDWEDTKQMAQPAPPQADLFS